MASTTKQQEVLKIALEYYYDGKSMGVAVNKANKDWQEQNKKRLTKLSTAQKEAYKKDLALAVAHEKKRALAVERARLLGIKKTMAKVQAEYIKQESFFKRHTTRVGKMFSNMGSSFMGKFGTIAGYTAVIAVIQTIRQVVTASYKAFTELEQAFVGLQAKANIANKDMKALTDTILDVAEATQFSSEAVTEAATSLGKLGFEAREIVNILPAVANGASAMGESLDKVSKTMGAIVNTFGLDSSAAGSVIDRLTVAFRTSALDLEKFSTAFNYVGAAASATGTNLDEVTAAMQTLADRGVTASKMGTGLRKIFVRLGEEGMSLNDVIRQMSEDNITFADSVALVGQIGASQLKILADDYDEYVKYMKAANESYGAAMYAAAIQQETVINTWARIQNTWKNMFAPGVGEEKDGWVLPEWGISKSFLEGVELQLAHIRDITGQTEDAVDNYWDRVANVMTSQAGFRSEWANAQASGEDMYEWFRNEAMARGVDMNSPFLSEDSFNAFMRQIENFNTDAAARRLADAERRAIDEVTKKFNKIREDHGRPAANAYARQASSGFKGGSKSWMSILDLRVNEDPTKRMDAQLAVLNSTKKLQKNYEDLADDEVESWKRRATEIAAITKELCDNAPQSWRNLHGIECPEKKGRRTSKRESLPFDVGEEQEFLKKQAELLAEYGLASDPVEKDRINKELLDLEQGFYASKLIIIEDYITKQDAILSNANLSESDRADYESNKQSGQKAGTAVTKKALTSLTDRLTKEHEIKQKAWKTTQVDAAYHNSIMKRIDAEADLTQSPEDYAAKMEEKKKEVARFYDEQLKAQKEALRIAKKNIKDAFGTDVDVSDSQAIVDNNEKQTATIFANRAATFFGIDKDLIDDEDDEVTRLAKLKTKRLKFAKMAVDAAAQAAEIYKSAAADRLAILEEQYAREVQLLEEKYSKEAEARNGALEAGVISQEDATRAEIRAEKRKQEELNAIAEKQFEAQKKAKIESLIIDGIVGAAQATITALASPTPWMAAVVGGIALAASAQAVAAESRRQYVPQIFAEGGVVRGPSHSAGGVPFSVAGRGGYEMEGGEYIINKKAVAENFALLEAINGKTKNQKYFATGGYVPDSNTPATDLNLAILQALDRPVRAFVTNQDLAYSESERRALESKINY